MSTLDQPGLLFTESPRHHRQTPTLLHFDTAHGLEPSQIHHTCSSIQIQILMSPRVTRSATRLAADPPPSAATPGNLTQPASSNSRKRKAPSDSETNPGTTPPPPPRASPPSKRAPKKQKVSAEASSAPLTSRSRRRVTKSSASMAKPGPSSASEANNEKSVPGAPDASRRKTSRSKKTSHESDTTLQPTASSAKRSKKSSTRKSDDTVPKEEPEAPKAWKTTAEASGGGSRSPSEDDTSAHRRVYEEDDDDAEPFRTGLLGPVRSNTSMSETLRQLTGYVSGVSQRLRNILNNLRQKDDLSVQLIALQELSELLLISNEDNLSGHFSPDQFVKELVGLMQPDDFTGDGNPEMMLLACRCLANMMEALPASISAVVYGGAVPVLCQKLLEIQFIDLAEQALSTLEKISTEFPSSIVRAGGLTACLTYLDFFATGTQRTAVTTAANCCKNIPQDSFGVIKEVMPILLNVLSSNDQRVVEQGSICVSRVVESFKYEQDKLEVLVSTNLLRAVRRLLQPGTTNLIGPNLHTQFLRVLSITAHTSPKLSAELLRMDIVDTLYQILTGVSPPTGLDDVASQIDSVFIMQALIHRPREQISETLNVICELLPSVTLSFHESLLDTAFMRDVISPSMASNSRKAANNERLRLLQGCEEQLRRFAIVLFPTLTDAYSSTVNLGIRQKVLTAQLKMLSNLDVKILDAALPTVPYASFLASILSQQDHPSLVTSALKAADLLLRRLFVTYGYQFYREGVMAEIAKLASEPLARIEPKVQTSKARMEMHRKSSDGSTTKILAISDDIDTKVSVSTPHGSDQDEGGEEEEDDDDQGDDDEAHRHTHEDMSPSPSESSSDQNYPMQSLASERDVNILFAKRFIEGHETSAAKTMRDMATRILKQLQSLAKAISTCYLGDGYDNGSKLFFQLSEYFQGDAVNTVTSSELLQSEVVDVLLDIFSHPEDSVRFKARTDFLQAFTNLPTRPVPGQIAPTPPFNVFINKLHDLLSRSEHFEVVTVHHNAFDNSRSNPSSILSKQLRLRLVSDDQSEIPRSFNNLTISIHAIATFKALDDYLRPRISLAERPKGSKPREGVSNALAAFVAAAGIPAPHQRLEDRSDSPSFLTPSEEFTKTRDNPKSAKPKQGGPVSESVLDGVKSRTIRRSSRRNRSNATGPAALPVAAPERVQTPLECADERQLTDNDDDDLEDSSALDAIVDDLEDGMDSEQAPEPTAVNMEVASTGKVTARKEDGTRVATPSQGTLAPAHGPLSSRSRELLAASLSSSAASRAMSYAAAIQAVPQDWHIEFSIDGHPVPNDMTIYRAVHYNDLQGAPITNRNIWSSVHTVKFKRVSGPPPSEPPLTSQSPHIISDDDTASTLPSSLREHPQTSKILQLLKIFHEINTNLDDVIDDESTDVVRPITEPLSQFVNTKLTAKLNRQLEEPLIVASSCLPTWSEDLARLFPFLFPFETRHLFLQSTSFGYARSMARWQNQSTDEARRDRLRDDRPFMGKLQRQKVRISRSRILESACKVMEIYGDSSSILEIEYFDEVGTGLGPTLEFYSTVSKEFSKKKTRMWRTNDANEQEEYAFGKNGMFPAPMLETYAETESGKKILNYFKMLGKFVARSMLDSRIIDVSLNPAFFRIGDHPRTGPPSLGALKTVDSHLTSSLKLLRQYAAAKMDLDNRLDLSDAQRAQGINDIAINGALIEDLSLDFTLPGYPHIELVESGADTPVTMNNVAIYVDRVIDMTLGSGIQRQVDHFRAGFSEVFPYSALKAFTPVELVMLFGRVEEDWSIESKSFLCAREHNAKSSIIALCDSIKADHGYNMDSKSVRNLLQVMSELTLPQRRDFLQFVTGSPKLPIGGMVYILLVQRTFLNDNTTGFKSLNPMFTVVCKPSEAPYTSDDFLISVMTCANYLKLPDYSDVVVLRRRLLTAISEGQVIPLEFGCQVFLPRLAWKEKYQADFSTTLIYFLPFVTKPVIMSETTQLTYSEVSSHNSKKDLYVVVHDKIYNTTTFIDEHPGGEEVLLDVAGQDATEAFEDVGHSDEAREILAGLLVGNLKRMSNDPKPKTQPPPATTITTSNKSDAAGMSVALYAIILLGGLAAFGAYKYLQVNSQSNK
ncbi:MAG: hypothetical protein Q9163_002906 [Psora crenata]